LGVGVGLGFSVGGLLVEGFAGAGLSGAGFEVALAIFSLALRRVRWRLLCSPSSALSQA
jgi:hypothetical protein